MGLDETLRSDVDHVRLYRYVRDISNILRKSIVDCTRHPNHTLSQTNATVVQFFRRWQSEAHSRLNHLQEQSPSTEAFFTLCRPT